jgi:hypothetical protein
MITWVVWQAMDLIDATLDKLSDQQRWNIIDFLMDHKIKNSCIKNAVSWSMWPGDSSFFDIGECNYCGTNPLGTYCGKARP